MTPARVTDGDQASGQFVRFAAIGACGLLVDVGVLYLCLAVTPFGPLSAKVVSFAAAVTFTWWMNRTITFRSTDGSLVSQWCRFVAANSVGQCVNLAVYATVVLAAGRHWIVPAVATAGGSLAGLGFNFVASRKLVFGTRARG